ncbi:MAG: hypothetical protein Tsb0017_02940 [Geothermobacteraceae bacterium]
MLSRTIHPGRRKPPPKITIPEAFKPGGWSVARLSLSPFRFPRDDLKKTAFAVAELFWPGYLRSRNGRRSTTGRRVVPRPVKAALAKRTSSTV